jgi:hypothetical protein
MISSRSFLFMCDHHIENPESESRRLPITFPTKEGETVYIHPTALKNFVVNYLPYVKFPFILVSGDSDTTVPHDVRHEAQHILQHPMLIKWYSQNCIEPSDKLRQLPIGLYFHVMYTPLNGWAPLKKNIEYYENLLDTLKKEKTIKINKCFSNFHFLLNTRYAEDRIEAINLIPRNLIDYQTTKISSEETWKLMSSYKFVVSPHGNGLDCHRTWEAIYLGCIPIVKSSSLDSLFKGLPILIVKEWSDVTQELLNTFKPDYSEIEKLRLDYWYKTFKE